MTERGCFKSRKGKSMMFLLNNPEIQETFRHEKCQLIFYPFDLFSFSDRIALPVFQLFLLYLQPMLYICETCLVHEMRADGKKEVLVSCFLEPLAADV